MIRVSSAFDSGNITVLEAGRADDIRLAINRDTQSHFFQWFHFRVTGARDSECVLRIMNAGEAGFPRGWEDYRAVASADRQTWIRVPTEYSDGVLTIRHRPPADAVHYAYFAPYSMERHDDLIARCQASEGVSLLVPGTSAQGRPIDVLRFGESREGAPPVWVIARQHPGETMAEWFMEGLLDRLLDRQDGAAAALRREVVLYAVANMNPDGSVLGNLRVNRHGANLNREWEDPSPDRSPEVHHVRDLMHRTGVDLCLDVHGDEGLPYAFIVGLEGIAEASAAQRAIVSGFRDGLARLNPDFQTRHGYPVASPGQGNTTTCTGYLGKHLAAASMTLEMPFKDAANAPDPVYGWSPDRSRALGRSTVEALLCVLPDLKALRETGS